MNGIERNELNGIERDAQPCKMVPNGMGRVTTVTGGVPIPNVIGMFPNVTGRVPMVTGGVPNVMGRVPMVTGGVSNVMGRVCNVMVCNVM